MKTIKTEKMFNDRLALYGQKFDGTDKASIEKKWAIRLAVIGLIITAILISTKEFCPEQEFPNVIICTEIAYFMVSWLIATTVAYGHLKAFLTKSDISEFVGKGTFVDYKNLGPASYLDVITNEFPEWGQKMHNHFIYPADLPENEAEFIKSLRGKKGPKWTGHGHVMAINDPIPAENDIFEVGKSRIYIKLMEAHLFPEHTNWKCLIPVEKNEKAIREALDRLCEAIVMDIVRKKMEEALCENYPLLTTAELLSKEDIIPYFDIFSEEEVGEEILRLFEEANAVIEDSLKIECPQKMKGE